MFNARAVRDLPEAVGKCGAISSWQALGRPQAAITSAGAAVTFHRFLTFI
jgi:hypothetical protein